MSHPAPSPRARPGARRTFLAAALATALLLTLGACAPEPVTWEDGTRDLGAPPATSGARLAVDSAGAPRLATPVAGATAPVAADSLCPGSLRIAAATPAEWHAVWWTLRADTTALLLAARSDDGGASWKPPVPVDARDQGRRGCDRPAPDVAADAATGYVHVVYWLTAPEGPGVFFAHSMEHGEMYHAPVAITYGARPAAASIAAWRDTVAVAHEDANADRAPLGLALSRTSGHIFEERLAVPAAADGMTSPLVALRGDRLVVAWRPAPRLDAGVQPEARAARADSAALGGWIARAGRIAALRGRAE